MKGDVEKVIDRMEPGEAVAEMGEALKRLLPILDEADRTRFVLSLMGDSGGDKLSSMVHL
ncbi:MAG: hypothetical protein WB930_03630 [Syntrophobacteraceae bacterium]